ncbi:MAG: F0F1 ATP synthase subunit C [Alphaproteobacteria bacterium]
MDAEAAKFIGAGLAVLPLFGAALGLGNLFSNWISAIARNPEAAEKFQTTGFIGFAITEATGIFALLIAFLILYG